MKALPMMSVVAVLIFFVFAPDLVAKEPKLSKLQKAILTTASRLMENNAVSYVYGGSRIGREEECKVCNQCLSEKSPTAKLRVKKCPSCLQCSIDCSHFTQQVLVRSGLPMPYLPTSLMISLSKAKLNKLYSLLDIGTNVDQAHPGDLLVYRGHVVMLESEVKEQRGNIIHATSGREIKAVGQGIQRVRAAELSYFRGPLLRILRHRKLFAVHLRPIGQK